MKAVIQNWNPKGFGFVQLPEGRAFVHVSVVKLSGCLQMPRPVDLTGREVEIRATERGDKGLKVTEAMLLPVAHRWHALFGEIAHYAIFFKQSWGVTERLIQTFIVMNKEAALGSSVEPKFDRAQYEAAKAAGCSREVLGNVIDLYRSLRRKWKAANAEKADREFAVAQARILVGTLPAGMGVVIYPTARPEVKGFLTDECHQKFVADWEAFVGGLTEIGRHGGLSWAATPVFEEMALGGKIGYCTLQYTFRALSWEPRAEWRQRVFLGSLWSGNSTPHRDRD